FFQEAVQRTTHVIPRMIGSGRSPMGGRPRSGLPEFARQRTEAARLPRGRITAVQTVTPQSGHRGHASRTRGKDVALVIADIDTAGRRHTDPLCRYLQRQRMRFALGQRVAADQHRAALLPAQLRQDQPGKVLRPAPAPRASSRYRRTAAHAGRSATRRYPGTPESAHAARSRPSAGRPLPASPASPWTPPPAAAPDPPAAAAAPAAYGWR